MALGIVTQDLIIDETAGLQNPPKDDVDPSVPPHSTNTTLQYLLGRDGPGGLASLERKGLSIRHCCISELGPDYVL